MLPYAPNKGRSRRQPPTVISVGPPPRQFKRCRPLSRPIAAECGISQRPRSLEYTHTHVPRVLALASLWIAQHRDRPAMLPAPKSPSSVDVHHAAKLPMVRSANQMKIKLTTLAGETSDIHVADSAKLRDLRTAICIHHSYKPDSFELWLDEQTLERDRDAYDLKSLGVSEERLVTVAKKQSHKAVNMCFFNTAFVKDDFPSVINVIRRTQDHAPEDEPLVIMVSYFHADVSTKNQWGDILRKAKMPGVCSIHLLLEGFMALLCNVKSGDACSFIRMDCHEMCEHIGISQHVHLSELICSMEMAMRLEDERLYNMDVIWTPYLSGSIKGCMLGHRNVNGAVGLMHARRMLAHAGHVEVSPENPTMIADASQEYRRSFGACIMVTHCSDVPVRDGVTQCYVTWYAHGKVRVSNGTLENKKFKYIGDHDSWILQAVHCLRLRPRKRPGTFPEKHCLAEACRSDDGSWLNEPPNTTGTGAEKCPRLSSVPSSVAGFVLGASAAASSADDVPKIELNPRDDKKKEAADVEPESDNVCMVCLDFQPSFVMADSKESGCGHFGLCNRCRTSMYLDQNNKNHGFEIPKKAVIWKKLFNKQISCPYCRSKTKTVHRSQYKGTVYICG